MATRPRHGAFTLIELLVVIAIISMLIGIMMPALGQARRTARQIKDATQVRSVVQSLVIWGQNNQDQYPLPSGLDKEDKTVLAADPVEKDNTGNILSLLIFDGYLPPVILRNPAEVSDRVEVDEGYEYYQPQRAEQPSGALWDPGFAGVSDEVGTGTGKGRRTAQGNTSYAHNPPFGKRRRYWNATYNSNEAVIGDRGPVYGGYPGNWSPVPGPYGTGSQTLQIHGSDRRWEGNIGFNDGRVAFINEPDPRELIWSFPGLPPGETSQRDNVFVTENDTNGQVEPESLPGYDANAFLRPYYDVRVQGGETVMTPRWD